MASIDLALTAERLRSLRKKAGKSQGQIADALGIGRSAYTYYEMGTRLPTSENLFILAEMYGVTTDYLLGRTDRPEIHVIDPPETLSDIGVKQILKRGEDAFTPEQIDILRQEIRKILEG